MPSFAILIALIGLSAAATMRETNGKPSEIANNDGDLPQDALPPMTSFEDILATGKSSQGSPPGEKDAEVLDAMKTKAVGMMEEQRAEEVHEDNPEFAPEDEGLESPIGNGEMAMGVPEMFVEGSPESTFQNGLTQRAGKPINTERENGFGNGQHRPATTSLGDGNSKRGGSFSSSAASATSFSKGPNSHAASQAQAFSFGK